MRGWIVLLILLLPFSACAQATKAAPDSYPSRTVRFADGVTGLPDIVYASYPGYRPLLLDLYLPPGNERRPLVLYIHGGSLRGGDARHILGIPDFPAVLARLASRGYAVAAVNYRLSGEARFPAQVQDVNAAIAFLRTNAGRYHVDPARVLTWGASSGGALAALVAAGCGRMEFMPPSDAAAPRAQGPDCVQGAAVWYGDMDLAQEPPDSAINAALGCDPCDAAQLAAASPIHFVTATAAPMLLVHGLDDPVAPVAVAQAMARTLAARGVAVETQFLPGVGHGFTGKTPAATKAANDRALARTFAYIDRLFGRPR